MTIKIEKEFTDEFAELCRRRGTSPKTISAVEVLRPTGVTIGVDKATIRVPGMIEGEIKTFIDYYAKLWNVEVEHVMVKLVTR